MPKIDEMQMKQIVENISPSLSDNEIKKLENAIRDVSETGKPILQSLGLTKGNLELIYEHGQQLYNVGSYSHAEGIFILLCLLSQDDEKYWFALAACYHKMKRYADAIPIYRMASNIEPKNPIPYYHLADCLMNNGEETHAHLVLVKVYELCGDNISYKLLKNRSLAMIDQLKDKPVRLKELVYDEMGAVIGIGGKTFEEIYTLCPDLKRPSPVKGG